MKKRPSLQTPRLLLRPFDLLDVKSVEALSSDRAIADTTVNVPHPYKDGMAKDWISTHQPLFEKGELSTFAITEVSTSELVGNVSLTIEKHSQRAELGYWIGRPFWGNGYATEASHAVLEYGFSELSLHRIYAGCFTRNPASGKVLRKIGMKHEGCSREHVRKWDAFEDVEQYAILASDRR
jgi:RimJ/RimL family protein N-acetyltransferase